MAVRRYRLLVLAVALFLVLPARGQEKPKEAPKDAPLPQGAKLRLGGNGLRFRFNSSICLLPPDYQTVLVPTVTDGVREFDVATGRPTGKGDDTNAGMIVVSGDGKRFTNVRTGSVSVKEVATNKKLYEPKAPRDFSTGYASTASTIALSKDGKRVAQGGQSKNAMGVVFVWDTEKDESLFQAGLQHEGLAIPVLSPDGKYLATRKYQPTFVGPGGKGDPNAGRAVQVWEVDAGKELFTALVSGNGSVVNGMAFSLDGKTLAISCGEGPIDLWDVPSAKHKATLLGRTRQGMQVAFSPDGKTLAAVAADGTVQRWNVADGKLLGTTEWPTQVLFAQNLGLAFADNERVVAWGMIGQAPVVWEAPSGKKLSAVPEHTSGINSIAFAGGKEIVTSAYDSKVMRWDAATGKPIGEITLRGGRGGIIYGRFAVAFSPDGTRALSAASSPASLFDLSTGAEILAVPSGQNFGFAVQTVPSSDMTKALVISTTYDPKKTGTCVAWDLVAQKKLGEVTIPGGQPPRAALTPSGERLVLAGYGPPGANGRPVVVVTGWDLKTGKKLGELQEEKENAAWQIQIAVASESKALIATGSGEVRIYDFETGKAGEVVVHAAPRTGETSPVVFSPDRKRFAMGYQTEVVGEFGVSVYEWPSGKELHKFRGHTGPVTALAFSEDGKLLASGSQDTSVLVWDLSEVGK